MSDISKQVDERFSVCDECDYDRGFHVSLKQRDSYEVILICPGCGQRYSVNWQVEL